MISKKLIAVPALMGALFLASSGQKAQAADTGVTLKVNNFTTVTATQNLTMTPELSDVVAGSIETLSGIDLNVVTNNGTGCKVTVSAAAGDANSGKIAPADISLRVAQAGAGAAAGTFAAYTPLNSSAADLWNTTEAALEGTDVELDVVFNNLAAYPTVGGAQTNYTNTITFTTVANS